jgi:hypothetical protein
MVTKKEVKSNLGIENARIGFRNFTGKEGRFNPAGQRNFCVFLDTDQALILERDGWNIKWLEPREPEDEKQAYLPVGVTYSNYPPKVMAITSSGKTILDEDSIHILDWAEFETIDLIIRPYNWEVNKKRGVKAYLKAMYATLIEDEFEQKYRTFPDTSPAANLEDGEPPWHE